MGIGEGWRIKPRRDNQDSISKLLEICLSLRAPLKQTKLFSKKPKKLLGRFECMSNSRVLSVFASASVVSGPVS